MNNKLIAASALAVAFAAQPALAAPVTDNMNVTVTVTASCTVSVTDMDFADIVTRDTGSAEFATATVTVACTADAPYHVGFDTGANEAVDGTAPARLFNNDVGVDNPYLTYGLYTDVGHSDAWGDEIGTDTVLGTGDGDDQTLTVYGQIDAAQEVSLGDYSDTVVVSVWYTPADLS